MIIKKLNTVFHKHSRVLFGVLTLIIIVSFIGFLTPGQFGCGDSAGNQTVGEVYGKKVSVDDLNEFIRKLSVLQPRLDIETDQILFLYAVNSRADQLGVCVSDAEVYDFIAGLPQCMKDGKYDKGRYGEYLESLKKRGFSEEDLFESVRLMLKPEKLRAFVASQVEVTPSEVEAAFREHNTKLYFTTASFDNVDDPDDATLKQFFASRRAKYCCAKVAVFPFNPENPMEAEKRAYDFRMEVNKAARDRREAEFDVLAKKHGIKVIPATWVVERDFMFGEEISPTLVAYLFRSVKNPDDRKPLTDVISERLTGTCYVGCLVDTAGRDELAEVKERLKHTWRVEKARELALREAERLAKEPKLDVRRNQFMELVKLTGVKVALSEKDKPFVFTKPKPGELGMQGDMPFALMKIGDVIPVPTQDGASIYILDKRVPPAAAMTAEEKKEYEKICRAVKANAAWQAFIEDVMANCKSLINREGRR